MTTVELTRFQVEPAHTETLLAARPAMLAEFRSDRHGFVDALLVELPGNEWLDIVTWRSADDFIASRARGPNLPGIRAFFDAIDRLVSSEAGTLAGPF